MKKRLISFLLILSMIFTMVPMLGIGVGAKYAKQMTEAEAKAAGINVYTAWFNTVNGEYDAYNSALQKREELSPFNVLYDSISSDKDYLNAMNAWKTLNFVSVGKR